jgi:extracellular elastinolytic metalloproteinase
MSQHPTRGKTPKLVVRSAGDEARIDAAPPAIPDAGPAFPRITRAIWIGSGPFRVLKFIALACFVFGLAGAPAQAGISPPALGPDHRPQPLTAPRAGDPATIATEYLASHLDSLGLGAADLDTLVLQSRHHTAGLGTNLFYQQKIDGVPVFNAITSVHVLDNGAILAVNNGAVGEVAGRLSARQPTLSAAEAFAAGLRHLGLTPTSAATTPLTALDSLRQGVAFRGTGVTRRPVPVRLSYVPRADGSVRLAWEMYVMSAGDQVWYLHVDALDGAVLEKHNLVTHLDKYRVYGFNAESPISTESPLDRRHDLTAEFGDRIASPQGWHSGATTTGNNVIAVEDRDNNDLDGYQPLGTGLPGNLTFDFAHSDLKNPCAQPSALANIGSDPVNLEPCDAYSPLAPNTNLQASIVNLFYWNNVLHDVMMYYGFTEGAGNFQQTNFTTEGTWRDVDAVFAQAQDGSGTNNANFFTPPDDGVTPLLLPPAMQMYEWSPPAVVKVNLPTTFADFDDGDRVLSAATASFGTSLKDLTEAQRTGDVMLGNDGSTGDGTGTANDGCEPLVGFTPGKIALLDRGLCEFGVKVLNAEQAGAKGAIIANTLGREIGNPMGPGVVGNQVTIPSVMIGESNGTRLKTALSQGIVNLTLQILPVPSRDSDLDNGVIAHEYGHGISNRLIGGPSSIACLINGQLPSTTAPGTLVPIGEQMGEGWSDLYAMILTAQPTDTGNTPRGVGAYISFQNEHGPGIRRFPYSRNLAVNPLTYGNVPGEVVPHGVGTVWATMVWDMYWNLVDLHGFEPNLFNHTSGAGNVRTLHYINNGLVITKCRPSFVDARNAILLAEAADGNLGDSCPIWRAFARRGLGVGAFNPTGGEDHRQVVEDFTVPAYCAEANLPPEAGNDAYSTKRNTALAVAAPGVLANDADPDGGTLTARVIDAPRNARRFVFNPDGSFEYEPGNGFTGTDTFTYVAQDGQVSSAKATVAIEVRKK